ncbi:MAG: ATP-binding cassette domain-containing protein [Methanomassiliicoccales archaeon]|nr:ATP-binding cassette domain-containing protein [Methanomassiliicoccales archaeon]
MAVIEAKALTKKFGKFVAVDSLSLTVEEGEIFGLLGPNGAGKTTTIKMLTTLLIPTSGRAIVAGFDVVKRPEEVQAIIGYVPQLLSAEGSITGYENLLIFAKLYDVPKAERQERVRHALQIMGLTDAADKLVRQYSGGMVRRLEIAQSALHKPKVMFMDEPTVGLDPLARRTVWELVRELRRESNATIVLTTHIMEEAQSLCDRVGIMHRGKLVAIGTPDELIASTGEKDLDEVFIHFTGDMIEESGNLRQIEAERKTARRLG